MSDPKSLELELQEYLNKEPNLRREDRIKYLKAIYEKHLGFSGLEHSISHSDFQFILSVAKNLWTKERIPMYISNKKVDNSDIGNAMVIDSVLNYLNMNHLLRKTVRFDKKD
jgi:hypothetical protein